MSDEDPWKGWYQPEQPPAGGSGSDPTHDLTISSRMPPPGGGADRGHGAWPEQPPSASSPGGTGQPYGRGYGQGSGYAGEPGYGGPGRGAGTEYGRPYGASTYGGAPTWGGGRRWRFWGQPGRHGRRIALYFVILVLVIIVAGGGSYFWINGKLNHAVALPATTVTSAGTNWLIAGSDARTGITRAERAQLHLGAVGADASDSLMLLHTGSGKPVLISIPRDSYVPIPGHGYNKINAALAIGGPALLVQTVE
ncbi:MAG: LCP family protein, partial [Trebonia sp.]